MSQRWKRLLAGIVIGGALLAAVVAAAVAMAPGWLRGTIERVAGQALGRELKIAGAFDVSLSLTPTLSAADITLANARRGSDPSMVRARRIELSVDLVSLWSGPVRVPDLALEDVRVLLERGGDGLANWTFDIKPSAGQSSLAIEHAAVHGLELVYRARPDARPLRFGVREVDARLEIGRAHV